MMLQLPATRFRGASGAFCSTHYLLVAQVVLVNRCPKGSQYGWNSCLTTNHSRNRLLALSSREW